MVAIANPDDSCLVQDRRIHDPGYINPGGGFCPRKMHQV